MSSGSGSSQSESAISEAKSPPSKVCIVCCYSYEYYAIFIVDLESQVNSGDNGFIPTAPTLLLDRESLDDGLYTFCVLNSTLYMFEIGYRATDFLPRRGKSVYTYDLSLFLNDYVSTTSLKLDKSMLGKAAPDMLCPKLCPVATPTPDGKRIIVFSSEFFFDPSDRVDDAGEIDFELYNPVEEEPWKKLPSLYDYLRGIGCRPVDFWIKAFTFLTNSVFLVQTEIEVFTLDIDRPSLGWRQQDSFAGAGRIPFSGRFFVIDDDELCLATSGAYDVSDAYEHLFDRWKSSPFPKSSFGDDFNHEERRFRVMHVLDDDDFRMVQLQTGINGDTMYAHMLLDVCSFNLEKCREDKQRIVGEDSVRQLDASIVKSFKFVLDGQESWIFYPLCLLPIRAGTN